VAHLNSEKSAEAPEDQARIFEKFYRTRSSSRIDGTGLGLAIVKSIVEQHGGHVIVQSVPGQGSEFVVSLPLTSDSRHSGS
jgi:signal transduction histidine kinase